MTSFLSFSLLLIIIVHAIIRKCDFLSPARIFSIVILFFYFLHSLQLSGMQTNYGIPSFLLVVATLTAFWFGTKLIGRNREKQKGINFKINIKRFKLAFYALLVVVVGSYFITWAILGAPPLFSKVDRADYFVSGVGTLYLLIDSLSFLAIYDWFGEKILGKKSLLVLIIVAVMMVTVSNKFQIFALLCQVIVLYNVQKKRIKMKHAILMLLAAIVIFVVFYNFIYSGLYISSETLYAESGMKIPRGLSFLTEPYLYASYNFDNLFNYIFNGDGVIYGNGYYVAHGLLESLNITDFIAPEHQALDVLWADNLQHWWLTTGTIFREFYQDFGIFGMIVGSGIIGSICGYAYNSMQKNKNLFNVYLYVVCTVSLLFAFFTNNFIAVKTLVNIFCVYIVYAFCREKQEKK